MSYCAPGIKGNKWGGCLDRSALQRIINSYNRKYPNNPISVPQKVEEFELWNVIRDHMASACREGDELCLIKQTGSSVMVQDYYLPPKPVGKTKWLSTTDINAVLKQYEKVHPDFAFMGTVPINFDQIIEEYAKIDFCQLYHGQGLFLKNGTPWRGRRVRRFGFVFNLDPHYKRGSHWVCMFMDLNVKDPYIGYLDSYGYCPPPRQITKLMNKLKQQVKKCLDLNLIKRCNTIRHQHKNTECGVYCLYFIYSLLSGKTFDEVTENIILDDAVNRYRDVFFRPNK